MLGYEVQLDEGAHLWSQLARMPRTRSVHMQWFLLAKKVIKPRERHLFRRGILCDVGGRLNETGPEGR